MNQGYARAILKEFAS